MSLPALEIPLLTARDAERYLLSAPYFGWLGDDLVFRVAQEVLVTHRARLRRQIPNAVLRPIPPRRAWTQASPFALPACSRPRCVPADFRSLPPFVSVPNDDRSGNGYETVYVGSGVPASLHPSAHRYFALCMHCASSDTHVVYSCHSARYGRYETWTWDTCVWLCLECDRFNYSEYQDEH